MQDLEFLNDSDKIVLDEEAVKKVLSEVRRVEGLREFLEDIMKRDYRMYFDSPDEDTHTKALIRGHFSGIKNLHNKLFGE